MATITGLTAERMLEIEGASVIDANVVDGDLILIKHNGETVNVGSVEGPPGPTGPIGPVAISAIPGEIKMWSGDTLPAIGTYGKWVWADGAIYPILSHPLAAAHIADAWNTMHGLVSDPGGSNFRVPDLRGLIPAGLDAMPGGSRASPPRMSRADAILLAKKTGKEQHTLLISEMATHNHGRAADGVNEGNIVSVGVSGSISGTADTQGAHQHLHRANHITTMSAGGGTFAITGIVSSGGSAQANTDQNGAHGHNVSGSFSGGGSGTIDAKGGGGAHENVQPTIMVPYIVYLDVV